MQDREAGCVFRGRCGKRLDVCDKSPAWSDIARDHAVRCWSPQTRSNGAGTGVPATSAVPGSDLAFDAAALSKSFPGRGAFAARMRAVDRAALRVAEHAIVGLVGESGSGKSTLLRCIAGLEVPDEGTMKFLGLDLPSDLAARPRETLRSIQMVFQDPESTLNPALTVAENLRRHLQALRPMPARAAVQEIDKALEKVRLPPRYRDRLPHQLSGGEKQRVAIARAFLAEPLLILCDEPLSALDVSVQSAICQLLLDLQRDGRLAYIFVSHDLSIVRYIADHIVVMYLGETVEQGAAESFDTRPLHPYSEALFSASPIPDPAAKTKRILLAGQIADVQRDGGGCIFKARCPRRLGPICDQQEPPWQAVAGRRYRCHHAPEALRALQSEGA